MSPSGEADLEIAQQVLERRLREAGLSPRVLQHGISTGLTGLELHPSEAEVATAVDAQDVPHYLGSLEVTAIVRLPEIGEAQVVDLITLEAESPVATLERCAETYMDVTFPALRGLIDGLPAPGTQTIELSSYAPQVARAIRWDVFSGMLQILDDTDGGLADRLRATFPMALVLDTLTGYLDELRLHWCKLFGSHKGASAPRFGCSIDGVRSDEAEAEMREKFLQGGEVPGEWEFRQFFVLRPAGEADAQTAATLRDEAEPPRRRR
jgi:hypothetical protein